MNADSIAEKLFCILNFDHFPKIKVHMTKVQQINKKNTYDIKKNTT